MLLKLTVLATRKTIVNFMEGIRRLLGQTRLLWSILLASLLLGGCVQYDLAVTFDSPNQGEIVQSIQLGERFTALISNETAQEWLDSLERRAKKLDGRTKRISDKELIVTIPFYYGAQLEQKFNQFFNSTTEKGKLKPAGASGGDFPEIQSHLSLNQNNFLLWQRQRLSCDLDLRSLSALSSDGSIQIDPGSLLDLKFRLNTPGGARSVAKGENAISPEIFQKGHELVWTLEPGQMNHLEVIFWLPSPLGIGAVMIVLFVIAGIYLKYNLQFGYKKSARPN